MAGNTGLEMLANLLKSTQHRRAMENTPSTPPATATAQLPPFQIPGMNASPVGTPPFLPPQQAAAISPIAPAQTPSTPVSPPPTVSPGDQPGAIPPVTDMGFVNGAGPGGPNTPGFWERINQALKAQQIPDGYRGVMGEMIKNG